jgi:hypothetical protein
MFNSELYERVMFIRLFDGIVLKVIYRRVRNDSVIMISELVKDMGNSIIVRISVQVQRKTTGHLIQGSKLHDRDLN